MPQGYFDADGVYFKACSKCTKDFAAAGEDPDYIEAEKNFFHSKTAKDGYTSWCKSCYRDYQDVYKRENAEVMKERREARKKRARQIGTDPDRIKQVRELLGLGPDERLTISVVEQTAPKIVEHVATQSWMNLKPQTNGNRGTEATEARGSDG